MGAKNNQSHDQSQNQSQDRTGSTGVVWARPLPALRRLAGAEPTTTACVGVARDGASATAAGCALVVALWAWIAGSDPSTVAARAVATLIVAALAARLRAAPPTASVEACFYAVHESPQGAECASPMVYRRAARLAADARAASGPRGVQRGLLISPRERRGDSEDHADQDSPERAATTRDGLTLL